MASLSSSERGATRWRSHSRSRPARRWPSLGLSVSMVSAVRVLFALSILVTVIPFGSVSWANLDVATIAMAGTAVLAMLVTGENPSAR